MAVREIIRMGHPTLRQVARPLDRSELGSPELNRLLGDMIDTLHDAGGVGLAAPQINVPVRLAIIEISGASRYGDIPEIPLTVFVNPEIEVVDGAEEAGFWEGCLSVPGLRGFVERPQHVIVKSLGLDGEPFELELKGFLATVFQHEFDHLDGRLYVDRIRDTRKLVFEDQMVHQLTGEGD